MKLTISTIAAMLVGTTAFANVADPRAELFRANGCQAEFLRPVTNADGEVLYWTNTEGKGCKADRGKTHAAVVQDEDEEEDEEVSDENGDTSTDEVIDASY